MATRYDPQHHEREVLDTALKALGELAGIDGKIVATGARTSSRAKSDAVVDLRVAGQTHRYLVECKHTMDRASALALVRTQLARHLDTGLLVTPYLSPQLAEHSRQLGLQFIDTAGNAYLKADGLYVFVSGRKPLDVPAQTSTRSAGNATTWRMVFALLCEPALIQAPYREMAEAAGIALGSVGAVLRDLTTRGLLVESARGRRLAAPTRMLDEWVTGYPTILRPKLHPRRFQANDPNWWQDASLADLTPLSAQWGSEVAAARMTDYLKPATQTLYIDPPAMRDTLRHLVTKYRLQPSADGPIELLETFWRPPTGHTDRESLVPPILVYADLIATMDSRNLETANLIREKSIARVLDSL
ncbi:type IV toxin-antitoxin system AbiEi family antitoxin [Ralstonia sp. A12]|uniref:type IV toxin-antitoxin system AbiEi family antitoxin n=1 Tax=Ralstonia sp. A12 TaxID=1217052 RepID=UPI0006941549|nr:type IV toxin-antitoxin system AbiEi family antitoxin [Ralstonia sp. A12]